MFDNQAERADDVHEQTGNCIREMETIRNGVTEML